MHMKRKRAEPQISAFAARRQAAAELEAQRVLQSQASTADTPSDEVSQEEGSEAEDADVNSYAALGSRESVHANVHESRRAQVGEAQKAASFSVTTHRIDRGLILGLNADTKVAVQGHCNFQILEGSVEFYGATLSKHDRQYQVSLPKGSSYPVISSTGTPVLRQDYFSDPVVALILFTKREDSLLDALDHYPISKSCFSAATSQRDQDVPVTFSSPEVSGHVLPRSWTKIIESYEPMHDAELSCTVLVGGKGAGKSTLARHLLNSRLSKSDTADSGGGVYYLDLDPGQPEFSVPGTTSLLFFPYSSSPSFSSPAFHTLTRPLKSHWIGETSPKEDPTHYMACTADLMQTLLHHHHHKQQQQQQQDEETYSSVIVNTPGWIKGTGMELLQSLAGILLHHHPFITTTTTLFLGSNTAHEFPFPVTQIEPVPPVGHGSTTASDSRTINLLSYFHRASLGCWRGTPVTRESWTMAYARVPVVIVREQLGAEDLIPAINGTIVALVAVNSETLSCYGRESSRDGLVMVQSRGEVLDPSTSRCLGLAIVHGIDLRKKTISLITPVPLDEASQELSGEELVICTGSIEVPMQFMTSGYVEGQERPYVTSKPGQGVGWQSWHVRRNIGRRVRNGQA